MRMNSNRYLHRAGTALCAGIMMLTTASCDKDTAVNEEFEIVNPGESSTQFPVEEVTAPTAILGNLGEAESLLHGAFTNIVDPASARVIIVDNESLKAQEQTLVEAYARGTLIVVFNPDSMEVSQWSDKNNVFYAGPEEDEDCAFYAFNNRGSSYMQRTRLVIDEDDVPLFHLCSWVNSVADLSLRGVDLRSKDIRKRFAPQKVSHTFEIKLDEKQILDGHWASAGQLALTTMANVTYNIYPLHVFDGDAPGDYYAVEAELVLHNAPLNNGLWTRRRGDELAHICGLYLNSFDVSARLLRKSGGVISESGSYSFAPGTGVHPLSADDATSYNPGFEWNLGATVSGGIPDSKNNHLLTTFNNWTWNNSGSEELPGLAISNNQDNAVVQYSLSVNGMPTESDDITVTAVPDLTTGDITFRYSWIWRIADVNESSDDRFYMLVDLDPIYRAYQWINAGQMNIGEFGKDVSLGQSSFRFPLTPPNRVATGSAVLRNSADASYYIRDIRLWRDKDMTETPDIIVPQTICTPGAHGGSGISATMLILPAGNYTVSGVRYSVENDQPVDEHVIVNRTPITVTVGGNAQIDFGSDIFTVL